ncbi:MAG TPA: hypothetical protein DEF27_08565 [Oscillatoriales bacterium UBA8482]|nr:MAG: hypothetical protein AUK43_10580 [Oscillatoriales cyanobacterium CG2_30_40_61]HBW57840.1 hypothetical protein [Oscillatoriales bacterium UBA8482]
MDAKHPNLPYTVSEDGSMLKVRGQGIKKTTRSTAGYRQISCYGKTFLVHRVVWEAFNGEIPQGLQINHIDGNKANNSLSNLELVTPAENIRHAVKTGLKQGKSAETNSMAKLTNEQYLEIIHDLVNGATNQEVADKYGLHSRYISLIRHRKRLKSVWQQFENENQVVQVKNSSGLNSKIPIEQRIEAIKRLPTCSNKELAQWLDVDCSVISNVRHRKTWIDAWEVIDSKGATTSGKSVGSSEPKRGASY